MVGGDLGNRNWLLNPATFGGPSSNSPKPSSGFFQKRRQKKKKKPKAIQFSPPTPQLCVLNRTASFLWSPFLDCLGTHMTKYFHLKFWEFHLPPFFFHLNSTTKVWAGGIFPYSKWTFPFKKQCSKADKSMHLFICLPIHPLIYLFVG